MHQVADRAQHCAKLAAGVEDPEVLWLEAAPLQQRHGQGVAKRDLQGGGGGGRIDLHRGLIGVGELEDHIGGLAQGAPGLGGQRDQRNREALCVGDHVRQLRRFAGFR